MKWTLVLFVAFIAVALCQEPQVTTPSSNPSFIQGQQAQGQNGFIGGAIKAVGRGISKVAKGVGSALSGMGKALGFGKPKNIFDTSMLEKAKERRIKDRRILFRRGGMVERYAPELFTTTSFGSRPQGTPYDMSPFGGNSPNAPTPFGADGQMGMTQTSSVSNSFKYAQGYNPNARRMPLTNAPTWNHPMGGFPSGGAGPAGSTPFGRLPSTLSYPRFQQNPLSLAQRAQFRTQGGEMPLTFNPHLPFAEPQAGRMGSSPYAHTTGMRYMTLPEELDRKAAMGMIPSVKTSFAGPPDKFPRGHMPGASLGDAPETRTPAGEAK